MHYIASFVPRYHDHCVVSTDDRVWECQGVVHLCKGLDGGQGVGIIAFLFFILFLCCC